VAACGCVWLCVRSSEPPPPTPPAPASRPPHEVLGVAPGADAAAVSKAYKLLSRTHHPDRGGDSQVGEVGELE
jgi:curved DNA-binding protein